MVCFCEGEWPNEINFLTLLIGPLIDKKIKKKKNGWSNQISILQKPKVTNFKSLCYLLDLTL